MRRYQKGIGFLRVVFLFAAVSTIVAIGMKVGPLYLNEQKIKRAVSETAKKPEDTVGQHELSRALERWWAIDDMQFIDPKEFTINSTPGKGRTISYDYYARADLFADISVIVHFKGDVPITGAAGGTN